MDENSKKLVILLEIRVILMKIMSRSQENMLKRPKTEI